ncbi:hypothetical protein GNP89_19710 [Aliivibrio fischeri]|nr:hypothetical protein [Aliivibrio fischeri]
MAKLPTTQQDTIDLNLMKDQLDTIEKQMQEENIEQIKYRDGTRAIHDFDTNETKVAGNGTIFHKQKNITSVHFINTGADTTEALADLHKVGHTQTVLGATVGVSQQYVSETLKDE